MSIRIFISVLFFINRWHRLEESFSSKDKSTWRGSLRTTTISMTVITTTCVLMDAPNITTNIPGTGNSTCANACVIVWQHSLLLLHWRVWYPTRYATAASVTARTWCPFKAPSSPCGPEILSTDRTWDLFLIKLQVGISVAADALCIFCFYIFVARSWSCFISSPPSIFSLFRRTTKSFPNFWERSFLTLPFLTASDKPFSFASQRWAISWTRCVRKDFVVHLVNLWCFFTLTQMAFKVTCRSLFKVMIIQKLLLYPTFSISI